MSKKIIGTMDCEGKRCKGHSMKASVVVFENEKGTLSYRCDYCGRTPYAREGTDMRADWMQDIKSIGDTKKSPEKLAPEKSVTGKPVPETLSKKDKSTVFG